MGDYAGAKAAIRQRLATNWTTTRITYQNEKPADPWPPGTTGADGHPVYSPWVHLEIATSMSEQHAIGRPGGHVWVTRGLILAHVFVPQGSGDGAATTYATQIGEIFRAKVFYNNGDGCYVRTWAPRVDEGGPASDPTDTHDGVWFRVSMSCPFEYWHVG